MKRTLPFATNFLFSTLLASCLASPAFAQEPGQGMTPELAAFHRLPAGVQRMILERASNFVQDVQTPGAVRQSWQVCGQAGPLQHCQSMEGSSWSVGLIEGAQVGMDRDASGRTSFGIGVEGTSPGLVGVTGQATVYPATQNVQVCAGPAVGVLPVFGGSVQRCWTVDHERAQEIREAVAYGQQVERNRLAQAEQARFQIEQQAAERARYEQQMRREIGENVYNPPAEYRQPQAAPARPAGQQPAPSLPTNSGLSQAEFNAQVAESMRQFQEADQYNRRNPLNIQISPREPAPQAEPASAPAPQTRYNYYQPRNGYDAYGNRPDSPRRRYDEAGYLAGPRQNRVYRTDGASRPIGQQVERYSADDGYAPSAGEGPSAAAASTTVSANLQPQAGSSEGARVVFDDNAPRGANLTRFGYDESARNLPAVAPRSAGSDAATASLQLFK